MPILQTVPPLATSLQLKRACKHDVPPLVLDSHGVGLVGQHLVHRLRPAMKQRMGRGQRRMHAVQRTWANPGKARFRSRHKIDNPLTCASDLCRMLHAVRWTLNKEACASVSLALTPTRSLNTGTAVLLMAPATVARSCCGSPLTSCSSCCAVPAGSPREVRTASRGATSAAGRARGPGQRRQESRVGWKALGEAAAGGGPSKDWRGGLGRAGMAAGQHWRHHQPEGRHPLAGYNLEGQGRGIATTRTLPASAARSAPTHSRLGSPALMLPAPARPARRTGVPAAAGHQTPAQGSSSSSIGVARLEQASARQCPPFPIAITYILHCSALRWLCGDLHAVLRHHALKRGLRKLKP